ncbi:MAG TPA: hypothetical protein VJS67_08255 [Pseudonocardiaceae bacterium]|nr:hypothetical protein [Pseudonocardiaceae bacterium]
MRHGSINTPQRGLGLGAVVLHELDAVVAGHTLAGRRKHVHGKVDTQHLRVIKPEQVEQAEAQGGRRVRVLTTMPGQYTLR